MHTTTTAEPTIRIRYQLLLSPVEATALLGLTEPAGALPATLPRGTMRLLGSALWGVFKNHGLIQTSGTGRTTELHAVSHAFDEVRFVLSKRRRIKARRWTTVPDARGKNRQPGEWITEITAALRADRTSAKPPPGPPAASTQRENELVVLHRGLLEEIKSADRAIADLRHTAETTASDLARAAQRRADLAENLSAVERTIKLLSARI